MTSILYDKSSFPEESVEELIPEPSEDEISQFKQQISEWIKIDEQIRKLSIALRERKTHQRALGKKVQEFMIQHKYTNIDTKLGIIKSNVVDVPVPVKLTDVRTKVDALDENVKLTKKEIIEKFFQGERPTVKKQSLTRKVPKVSMHLDL
jgi:hypothetical protein